MLSARERWKLTENEAIRKEGWLLQKGSKSISIVQELFAISAACHPGLHLPISYRKILERCVLGLCLGEHQTLQGGRR